MLKDSTLFDNRCVLTENTNKCKLYHSEPYCQVETELKRRKIHTHVYAHIRIHMRVCMLAYIVGTKYFCHMHDCQVVLSFASMLHRQYVTVWNQSYVMGLGILNTFIYYKQR